MRVSHILTHILCAWSIEEDQRRQYIITVHVCSIHSAQRMNWKWLQLNELNRTNLSREQAQSFCVGPLSDGSDEGVEG